MNLKKHLLLWLCCAACSVQAFGQQRLSRNEYIEKYKRIAIDQMEVYGIPASIKMAQALLESENGNSRLATEANNHFGIKCKKEWTGETITHDDDAPGECFRKYSSVEESFKDHSEFLDKSSRYQELFKLDPLDYKGWATGLKAAGYATNPIYAAQLIKIIEDNKLFLLDTGGDITVAETTPAPVPSTLPEDLPAATGSKVDIDNYTVSVNGSGGRHSIYFNNGSEFVLAGPNDSYMSIAREFGVKEEKLRKFNDRIDNEPLAQGDMVYVKAKNKRSENGKLIHIVKEGETLHSISQMYGIRLSNLANINRRDKATIVKAGQQIRLM